MSTGQGLPAGGQPPSGEVVAGEDGVAHASVESLLREAAQGRIGVDRRLLRSILEQPDAAAAILQFANSPHDQDRVDLDLLLIDLLRHYGAPEALDFFMGAIRRAPDDIDDGLIQALLPFGAAAVDPLIALYEELGEEDGSDVAFLLAGLRIHEPRVLALLLDRLEFDVADGAFCLGLYGDPAARQALEAILTEIPADDAELRREIQHALAQLDSPATHYEPEAFDIFADYPEREQPPFGLLPETERIELLRSADAGVRAGAAHSFFNDELSPAARAALLKAAQSDPEVAVRARSWESLADVTEDPSIRKAMVAILFDASRDIEERGGAAVGLYGVADRDDVRPGIEALYELGGRARVKALETMWRSLWEPYAKYFPAHLDDKDPAILREVLRGAGYFRLTSQVDKIASFFDREEPFDDLREDALFAYAMAMPGETTRGRVRGMFRKLDGIAKLSPVEVPLVEFALDERLRLHGLTPVFQTDESEEPEQPDTSVASAAPSLSDPLKKVGRNDPCPCGSGKKYKKCCGAA